MALPVTTGLVAHLDPATITANDGDAITSYPAVGGTTAWTVQGTGPIYRAKGERGQPYLEQTASGGTGLRWNQDLSTIHSTVFVVARQRGTANQRILSGLNNNWLLGWHNGTEDDHYSMNWVYNAATPATTNLRVYSGHRVHGASGFYRGNAPVSPLVYEPFDAMPPDIISTAGVSLDNGTLRSDGLSDWWYFTGNRFQVVGDFRATYDVMFPSGSNARDIANFAFWITDPGATADGYMFRLDTGAACGFLSVTDGAHSGYLSTTGATAARDIWYRTVLTATGESVRAIVTERDTGAAFADITWTASAGNRAGTFGQKHDGAGSAEGHRWDNIVLTPLSGGGGAGPNGLTTNGWTGTSEFSDADVYEVIIYGRYLTAAESRQVNDYLYDRYFVSSPYRDAVLAAAPVAYWRLGESSGANPAADEVGTAHGTYHANVVRGVAGAVPGRDAAAKFTGVAGENVSVPDGKAPDIVGDITVEAWIRVPAVSVFSMVVSKYISGEDRGWLLGVNANGAVVFDGRDGRGAYMAAATPDEVDDDKPHHIVGQRQGTVWRVFVDGTERKVVDHGGTPGSFANTVRLTIGDYNGSNPFPGVIDEVAIYDRALAATEIAEHHRLAIAPSTYSDTVMRDEPVGYWRLGETSGTMAVDASGSGLDGTYYGSPALGIEGALIPDPNTAVRFRTPGTDRVAAPSPVTTGKAVSVSLWWRRVGVPAGKYHILYSQDSGGVELSVPEGITDDGKLRFGVTTSDGVRSVFNSGGDVLNDGAWHHVAGTWDGTTMRSYIDGREVGSLAKAGALRLNRVLEIGRYHSATYGANGDIDEVAVYDYALSGQQVRDHCGSLSLYRRMVVLDRPVGYWRLADRGFTGGSGGTITDSGGYRIHTFTTSGTFSLPSNVRNAEVLIVGGGGGGGSYYYAGGGGGGGVLHGTMDIAAGDHTVVVGAGGAKSVSRSTPGAGGDSSLGSLVAYGGGRGGAGAGGSGGGANYNQSTGGAATQTSQGTLTGYGTAGGTNGAESRGGGGGGASQAGGHGTLTDKGKGGDGFISAISGTSQRYGAGGGGSHNANTEYYVGQGGVDGGGDASAYSAGVLPQDGTNGLGAGGGASCHNSISPDSGAGGSGVVIVKYALPSNNYARDEVGDSHGVSTGALVFDQDGPVDDTRSVQFNGGYFTILNAPHLQVVGNQTIEMWLRPDHLTARRNPINKAYGGEFTCTEEVNGSISYYWGTAGGNASPYQGVGSGVASVHPGWWRHLAVVRDLAPDTGNVAQGSPATNSNGTSAPVVTDGDTASANYHDAGPGLLHVTVDLGSVRDLNTVSVWHYYADSRTYYATKTEVSEDGATWETVFDSAVSGTYVETSTGRVTFFSTRPVRYIRDWLNGSTVNTSNHWVEIQASKVPATVWYINGARWGAASAPYAAATASVADVLIGSGYVGAYAGRISEIALYNRPLSQATIQSRLAGLHTAPTAVLFSPAAGTSVKDSTPELVAQVTDLDIEQGLTIEFQLFAEEAGRYSDIYADIY